MATTIDERKLEAFMGQIVLDMGAAISAPLVIIGEKLGLYRAMAGAGPLTSAEVAERAGASERYVREWLRNQAAGGYVEYDDESDRYTLPDEHAMALADAGEPVLRLRGVPAHQLGLRRRAAPRRVHAHGRGDGWHEHDHRPVRGDGALLPPGLQGEPHERLDPGARRRPGEARARCASLPISAAVTARRRS